MTKSESIVYRLTKCFPDRAISLQHSTNKYSNADIKNEYKIYINNTIFGTYGWSKECSTIQELSILINETMKYIPNWKPIKV